MSATCEAGGEERSAVRRRIASPSQSALDALVLDFDGLIIDTEMAEYRALAQLFTECGDKVEYTTWRDTVGNVSPDWIAELAPPGSDRYQRLQRRLASQYDRLVSELPLLPGVASLLNFAERSGLPVAVVTSATKKRLLPELEAREINTRVQCTITLEDVAHPKPSPEPYLLAMKRLNADPARSVAFEDSTGGVLSATSAGIRCVAVPNATTTGQDFARASLVLSSLARLDLTELAVGRLAGTSTTAKEDRPARSNPQSG